MRKYAEAEGVKPEELRFRGLPMDSLSRDDLLVIIAYLNARLNERLTELQA
jgi:hypothetical protein